MLPRAHCTFCRQVFPEADIERWVDGGRTPCCPRCGVDSVSPGASDPMSILQSYRAGFGHPRSATDPEAVRIIQDVSERLTRGEEVADDVLLGVIEGRARCEAEALETVDGYDVSWRAMHGLDQELRFHRDRFLSLPLADRERAWRAGGMRDELPYFCTLNPREVVSGDDSSS